MKKELNILIMFVALWCFGIIAAPLFSSSAISIFLYRFYSIVCHQFYSRSFLIHNDPFAVCIRCTSIYFGFLSALLIIRISSQIRSRNFDTFVLLTITSLPMFIDGTASLLNIHESTMLSRMITGSIFGVGMALLLHRSLTEIIHTNIIKKTKKYEFETR
jgi:uncharacterized membrane protein